VNAQDIDGAMRTLALMADYKVYVTVEHARVVLSIYKSLDLASGALNFVKVRSAPCHQQHGCLSLP
jgi:hypothetical protein